MLEKLVPELNWTTLDEYSYYAETLIGTYRIRENVDENGTSYSVDLIEGQYKYCCKTLGSAKQTAWDHWKGKVIGLLELVHKPKDIPEETLYKIKKPEWIKIAEDDYVWNNPIQTWNVFKHVYAWRILFERRSHFFPTKEEAFAYCEKKNLDIIKEMLEEVKSIEEDE